MRQYEYKGAMVLEHVKGSLLAKVERAFRSFGDLRKVDVLDWILVRKSGKLAVVAVVDETSSITVILNFCQFTEEYEVELVVCA